MTRWQQTLSIFKCKNYTLSKPLTATYKISFLNLGKLLESSHWA